MSIEIKNLLKEYGEQKAVNNISFKIDKGEIVGFLGPNGAGKSTTMKIITGYLQQNGGEAFVCGINVSEHPIETKKKIGYLPELNALYYDMYVREYLGFVAAVHKIENLKSKIESVIVTVGLSSEANKKIGQLSKGYKQRVGLAAALIHDPEVLILDEPTSGLDPNQIVEIREVIKKQGQNKTVLFSSHILQEVEAMCDRVIIIHKGNIVADDRLANLRGKQKHLNQVKLTLKETVHEKVFEGIQNIRQVDAFTWSFNTDDADALKRRLMEIALNKNLNIVNWETGSNNTLEKIFRELTTAGN
ncbi:MAG TPA: ATP-binding cassette domain-containing protein [Chitinophagaceae bacterium]|nr:ATP-binding cassette domain-containing protein [Chitinophagaceae bacterium]